MKDAGLEKRRIDEIVLIDGITSIHKVQQLLKEFLIKWNRKRCELHEAVAYGATVRGSVLSGEGHHTLHNCFLYHANLPYVNQ
ncbi:luminal-binding protein [Musa troglodytarum]|uniref:Luminal-binding protein n=1 Tax=Musa troglodytarum TaxID=320322 RepID=A0A9E7JYY8_9LILI|nr:luminal-binding protein [Musa troglodytarum]